jgi:hypothetical protein
MIQTLLMTFGENVKIVKYRHENGMETFTVQHKGETMYATTSADWEDEDVMWLWLMKKGFRLKASSEYDESINALNSLT